MRRVGLRARLILAAAAMTGLGLLGFAPGVASASPAHTAAPAAAATPLSSALVKVSATEYLFHTGDGHGGYLYGTGGHGNLVAGGSVGDDFSLISVGSGYYQIEDESAINGNAGNCLTASYTTGDLYLESCVSAQSNHFSFLGASGYEVTNQQLLNKGYADIISDYGWGSCAENVPFISFENANGCYTQTIH